MQNPQKLKDEKKARQDNLKTFLALNHKSIPE